MNIEIKNKLHWVLVAALAALACISLYSGFIKAMHEGNSQDFQYSPAKILISGENPYKVWGENKDRFLLAQSPNYLPLLFISISPLANMEWQHAKIAWALCNVAMVLHLAYIVFQCKHIPRQYQYTISLLFLSSLPVRNTIINGQQSVLILLMLYYSYKSSSFVIRGICSSLSLTKYSIGAFYLASNLWQKNRWKEILLVAAITFSSFIFLAIHTNTPINTKLFFSPLKVPSDGMAMSEPFNFIRSTFGHWWVLATALAGMVFCGVTSLLVARNQRHLKEYQEENRQNILIITSTLACLVFTPHAKYDYVILLLPFLFFNPLPKLNFFNKTAFILVVLYYWNGVKIIEHLHQQTADYVKIFSWLLIIYIYLIILINSLFKKRLSI